MKTGQADELFVAYGAHALAPETESALERHLEDCPECREAAHAQKSVWSALDYWEPPRVSDGFNQKLYARIEADGEAPWYRRLFQWSGSHRPVMPVAAACAAMLAAFLLKGPLPERSAHPAVQQNQIDIEQVERALDDIDMLKQLGVAPAPAGESRRTGNM